MEMNRAYTKQHRARHKQIKQENKHTNYTNKSSIFI
jgi:hypothetical protein